MVDKLYTIVYYKHMLNFITTIIKQRSITMARSKAKKAVGTKFFKEGTQNQKILAKFWGTGKTFTMDDLREKLDIASPGARLSEIKEEGFNVKAKAVGSNGLQGRPTMEYSIPRRRTFA